jgi:hypothetical protein
VRFSNLFSALRNFSTSAGETLIPETELYHLDEALSNLQYL